MAEVRCPMCGKLNPEGQEVCQFCQARLIPLVKPPAGDHEISGGKSDEDNVPDWLKDLRGDSDEFSDDIEQGEEEVPDWLHSDRDESISKTESDTDDAHDEADEVPDWLARLSSSDDTDTGEAASSSSPDDQDEELPDWLRSESSSEEPFSEWEQESQADQSGEMGEENGPEWLDRVRAHFQDDQEAKKQELQEGLSEEAQPASQEGEVDRSGSGYASVPAAGEEDEIPDWLSGLGRDTEETAHPVEAEEELTSEAGITDWINALDREEDINAVQAEGELSETSDEGIPDWLSSLQVDDESSEEELAEPVSEESAQVEIPEAFSTALPESDEEPPQETGEAEPDAAEVLVPGEEQLDALGEQVPDWLGGLAPEEETGLPEQEEDEQDEVLSELAGEEIPDWLSGLSAGSEEGQTPAESVPAMVVGDEEKSPEDSDYLTSLPEWVAQISEENEPSEEEVGEGPIERASLPEWLEAMRPVEAAAPLVQYADEGDEHVESAGPLAGLRGVLPAEPEMARARKASVYSIKLQVTDEQQARMQAIKRLIESESTPKSAPSPFVLPTSYIIRIMIFLVLVGAIVLVWWVGGDTLQTPLPSGRDLKDVLTASQLINQLSPDASVLIAVDYEPGFTGELDTAARAVISQLAGKGAYLALVSTSLAGPALGERLIASVPLPEGTTLNYVNLGFIPGNSVGLQWFAQLPAQVVPKGLDGTTAWLNNPLSTLDGLGSFSLVIVITADANIARAWIEQVQPQLSKQQIPLMMITSAQTEPMIRPYASRVSGQVSALVAGLAGGVAYENELGQYFPLSSYWGAFSAAMTVTVVLLIIGGVISLLSSTLERNKPEKGEE